MKKVLLLVFMIGCKAKMPALVVAPAPDSITDYQTGEKYPYNPKWRDTILVIWDARNSMELFETGKPGIMPYDSIVNIITSDKPIFGYHKNTHY